MGIFLYIFLGLLAGVLSGLFGVGGGIIMIPLFIQFLSYSSHQAVSLSLLSMSFPVFIFSLWKHYKAEHWSMDMIKWGALVALGMVIGSFFGASLSEKFSSLMLKKSFAVLLVIVAAKLWMDKN